MDKFFLFLFKSCTPLAKRLAVAGENVEDIEGGRVGTLTDGSTINVRLESTDGRPTVEIIHTNKKRTKFRFNEPE